MWQQFRMALTDFSGDTGSTTGPADTRGRVIAAAKLTFETLRRRCQHDQGS
jgi:hypothetical protein